MTVGKRGDAWCVFHGHPKKEGSKTDKPIGSVIKCFSIDTYGEDGARKKALAMHYAIMKSQEAQSFIVQHFQANLQSMELREMLNIIDGTLLDEIKKTDNKPLIKVFSIGHEGEAKGKLVGVGKFAIQYFKDAITKIHNKLKLGTSIFNRHSSTNSHLNREKIGELIGKVLKQIGNKLHTLAAVYIYPQYIDKSLDVASIEANVKYSIDNNQIVKIDEINDITGIAISSKDIDEPGFPGATLIGAFQAFAKNPNKGENNMTLSLKEVQEAIKEGGYLVTDFFTEKEILDEKFVEEHIAKIKHDAQGYGNRKVKEFEEIQKKLDDEVVQLKSENISLKSQIFQTRTKTLFDEITTERKLTDKQKLLIGKNIKNVKIEAKDEAEFKQKMNLWFDGEMKDVDEIMKTLKIDDTKAFEDKGKKGAPNDDGGKSSKENELVSPDSNPFIPGGKAAKEAGFE